MSDENFVGMEQSSIVHCDMMNVGVPQHSEMAYDSADNNRKILKNMPINLERCDDNQHAKNKSLVHNISMENVDECSSEIELKETSLIESNPVSNKSIIIDNINNKLLTHDVAVSEESNVSSSIMSNPLAPKPLCAAEGKQSSNKNSEICPDGRDPGIKTDESVLDNKETVSNVAPSQAQVSI